MNSQKIITIITVFAILIYVGVILNGTQAPGAVFIASVCDYFGADFFTDLFEVAGPHGEVTA